MQKKSTIPAPKFVGPLLKSEWFCGLFIDLLIEFASIELDLSRLPVPIELSDWIDRVDILEYPFETNLSFWQKANMLFRLVRMMQYPALAEPLLKQMEPIRIQEACDNIRRNLGNSDFAEVNRLCNELFRKAGSTKDSFDAVALLAVIRAAQTIYRCIGQYRIHPNELIKKARNGDRRATLDLIKIDKLFLLDSCTKDVLQKALLSGDRSFNGQLARAQSFKPVFGRRQACEIYMYLLVALQIELPPLAELRLIVDPEGTTFQGKYDFDKCFERRKNEVRSGL